MPLRDDGSGCLAAGSAEQIIKRMENMTVAAIGPGLTVSDTIAAVVREVVEESRIPLVLDADALNALSRDVSALKKMKVPGVITPHPGEMARLTGLEIKEVQADRMGVASRFAEKYGVTVALKGSGTIVANPDGRIFVNSTGNAGMATAGSGDVLTGIIAGLTAQGMNTCDAAVSGVFLHGLAGDYAAVEKGIHGMTACDIIEYLPRAIKDTFGNAGQGPAAYRCECK